MINFLNLHKFNEFENKVVKFGKLHVSFVLDPFMIFVLDHFIIQLLLFIIQIRLYYQCCYLSIFSFFVIACKCK